MSKEKEQGSVKSQRANRLDGSRAGKVGAQTACSMRSAASPEAHGRPGDGVPVASGSRTRSWSGKRGSGMEISVFDGQPFGRGGGVEVLVGRNQRHRSATRVLIAPVYLEGRRQLHGIVGPEPVLAGRQHRYGEKGGGQLQDIFR